MEIKFEWDEKEMRLIRKPDSPVTTREEAMQTATLIRNIRGDDPVARNLAKYEMAKQAYELRVWYQPCVDVPGGGQPLFLNDSKESYGRIADGIRALSRCTTPAEVERLTERSTDVLHAVMFTTWVRKVSTVESYNASNCQVLLMAHAWLSELNPDGDAAAIQLLQGLLRKWYRVSEPATEARDRTAQAIAAATRLDWLSAGWRRVWTHP